MARQLASAEELNSWSPGTLPGLLGVSIIDVGEGRVTGEMPVRPDLLAPNGYLHAASVVGLADTVSGYGTRANLPDGARGFTTIELKANFLGTALEGVLDCEATLQHGGKTTQVWDASVTDRASGRTIALFRCTQMILYPRS